MRAIVACAAFLLVGALNFLWWWYPNRPVEIPAWKAGPLQSVSFAPYRPGQSPHTRTFPNARQIEADLKLMQGKTVAVRTYSSLEGLEAVPRLAGKYGLKVWSGAWLNGVERENLEQVAALIDHANRYSDTIERVIVGNEVLLRKDLDAQQLTRYIRMVKAAVKQPVTYADVWEFWLRNPELADEVDIVTVHLLPYWEDVPIGLSRREPDGQLRIEKHIVDIYQKVRRAFPNKRIVIGETGWPSMGRMRADARPGRVEQVTYFSIFKRLAEQHGFEYNFIEAFDQEWKSGQEGTVGAAWGIYTADRVEKFKAGRPVSPEPQWATLFAVSTIAAGLMILGFASLRRRPSPLAIVVFSVFACAVATVVVQATWLNYTHSFYTSRLLGTVFYFLLAVAFGYALMRGIGDSLTERMADPSLYGARVREAWSAWRALPRLTALRRIDLLAQMLFLVFTLLCIYHLVFIGIDVHLGVIGSGEHAWVIGIDGRYRDFPIWDFVLPSFVLVAWKLFTIFRTGDVPRTHRLAKTLSFGRLLGFDGSRGYVRLDPAFSRIAPVLPELLLSALLIAGAVLVVVTEGAIKLHDGGGGGWSAPDGGRWVIGALFWNTQASWLGAEALLLALPYLATIYVSLRTPLAEPPPESYTSKW
jgi:exo-beta-1,3-glucanase (GH17 family)